MTTTDTEPTRWRKKPVEIEAVQFTGHNYDRIASWHDAPATPAAPGSSSPDTAALVAELRGPSGLASTSRAKHLTVGVCAVAADALEAQASRITELEQFLIRLGHNPVTWIAASISGEDPAEYAVPGTVTCTAATHDHPNQESL
jgi:hypothetical protein